MEQVVRNIKAINPDTRMFLYENSMEVATTNESAAAVFDEGRPDEMVGLPARRDRRVAALTVRQARIESQYQSTRPYSRRTTVPAISNGNGTRAGSCSSSTSRIRRSTASSKTTSSGRRATMRTGTATASPTRRTRRRPANGCAKAIASASSCSAQLMPGKHMIGNVADWGHTNAVLTELDQTLNGGVIEGIMGASYAPEKWGSWAEMMRWYRKTMAAIAEPKLVAFIRSATRPTTRRCATAWPRACSTTAISRSRTR